jgi:hypothetical protein
MDLQQEHPYGGYCPECKEPETTCPCSEQRAVCDLCGDDDVPWGSTRNRWLEGEMVRLCGAASCWEHAERLESKYAAVFQS